MTQSVKYLSTCQLSAGRMKKMYGAPINDVDWLRAAVEVDVELGCDVQIGDRLQPQILVDSIQLQAQLNRMRLYALLFEELKQLLAHIDFGSGAEAAFTEGRQIVYERMQKLSPEQQAALNMMLADSVVLPPTQIQAQLRQKLNLFLNEADWQQITATALSAVELNQVDQVACV